MYELKVAVTKVLGKCTADPAMKPGDYFTVQGGNLRIPEGGFVCLWALQSLMPILTMKERKIGEKRSDDWVWRVQHVQCPDPEGRVIWRIVRSNEKADLPPFIPAHSSGELPGGRPDPLLSDLRVVVEEVQGHCTSGMAPGDHFLLRSGRLYIPAGRHFCLYALEATLPLLPAKQRTRLEGDWLARDNHIICPDPAGNVVLRIERT
jgi:uncharacterized repeat protein (TIGR04076 family)